MFWHQKIQQDEQTWDKMRDKGNKLCMRAWIREWGKMRRGRRIEEHKKDALMSHMLDQRIWQGAQCGTLHLSQEGKGGEGKIPFKNLLSLSRCLPLIFFVLHGNKLVKSWVIFFSPGLSQRRLIYVVFGFSNNKCISCPMLLHNQNTFNTPCSTTAAVETATLQNGNLWSVSKSAAWITGQEYS